MSWKGFQKAVSRLPQMVMAKAGYSDETQDQEFNEIEERFKLFEANAKKLNEDAKKFKDALNLMLAHQASFARTLLEVYQPIGRGLGSSGGLGPDGAEEDDGGMRGASTQAKETPPESLRAAEEFAQVLEDVRQSLMPDLEVIERRLVTPTVDLLVLLDRVKRLMVKRAHKLLDYDRHRDSVKKMKERTDRTAADERTLGKYEQSLDQAARDYDNINHLLKNQIPQLLALKAPFIDPCFLTLYWYQLRVHRTLADALRNLMSNPMFAKQRGSVRAEDFAAKAEAQAELLVDLTLVWRNRKQADPYGSQDGQPLDQGYYSTDVSPTTYDENGGVTSPAGGAPPGYSDSLSPGGRPSVGGGFRDMHKSSAPPGHPISYPNPLDAASPQAAWAGSGAGATARGASPMKGGMPMPGMGPRKTYVVALYDYEAQADGDLSFRRDDRIEVVEKTENPNDWWTGTLNGRTGSFPANYVAVV
ncbi:hypothetical protein HK101_000318 [Irineochytrium annulatum]|nr:hypothetical protein HK101_000318 [Irineochytrium annulatum]